jgi:hypothetical protein
MSFNQAMNLIPFARRARLPQPASPDLAISRGGSGAHSDDATVDPRWATLRQINEFSLELYLSGDLGFPESAYLGRQPELHPAYRRTVGRLTQVDPDHDAPCDHLRLWEDRLAFAERYLFDDRPSLDRLRRIVGALRRHTARIDVAGRTHNRLAG